MIKPLLLIFTLFATLNALAQDTTVAAYLPEFEDWNETSREIYLGEDLFFLINGGAEVYLEYGFGQVLAADLQNHHGVEVSVEIYRMNDETAAYGIWSFNAGKGESAGIGTHSLRAGDYLMFQKGDAYVIVRAGEEKQMEAVVKLAETLAGGIPGGAGPAKWIRPFIDLDPYRTVFVRGNVALNNFYYFGYENVFNIQQAVVLEKDETKHIIIKYKDTAARQASMVQAELFLQESSKFESGEDSSFTDRNGNTLYVHPYSEYLVISISKEDIHSQRSKIIELLTTAN